jgi:lipopolysaccharide transport system permease protein
MTAGEPSASMRVYTSRSPVHRPVATAREMWRDLCSSRELAWRLFLRDFRGRYRRTLFGYAWAVLPPLITAAIWIVLRQGGIVSFDAGDVPYPVFILTGMVVWQTFLDALRAPADAVQQSKTLLAKNRIPREALLLAAAGAIGVNFLIRIVLVVGVFALFAYVPPWTILLAPIAVAGIVVIGMAVVVPLIPFGVLYGDVQLAIANFVGLFLYVTPIIYPPPSEGLLRWIMIINPVAAPITLARDLMLTGSLTWLPLAATIFTIAGILLLLGWAFFHVTFPLVIERISA